jgi:hypothetical protein
MVVLDICFCPEDAKTRWFRFGNQTVQFGGRRKLVSGSVLASIFTPRTLLYTAATTPRLLSMLGFISLLAKDSHPSPTFF